LRVNFRGRYLAINGGKKIRNKREEGRTDTVSLVLLFGQTQFFCS
jgi:hypothetical protein